MPHIGRLPKTLADRSIIIAMQKRKSDDNVQDFHDDRVGHLHELASWAKRWVLDHEEDQYLREEREAIKNEPPD